MKKIYTRTGDLGETSLIYGGRVSKNTPIIAFYGAIDESISWLGVVRAFNSDPILEAQLQQLQTQLFSAGQAALPPYPSDLFSAEEINLLEEQIDQIEKELPPLNAFILPGGNKVSAHLHLARTSIRKTERQLAGLTNPNPLLQAWLNRLSDLLFLLARKANQEEGFSSL